MHLGPINLLHVVMSCCLACRIVAIYIKSRVNVSGNNWPEVLSSFTTQMTEIPCFLTPNKDKA